MNILVSVIVPIYNVEEYLYRCVQSIMQQTYQNIEIILVDDGSQDHCPGICDELAYIDSRIKVIHKDNGGLSDARNSGMKIAKGVYYCFVDSDDYIEATMIERLIYKAVKSDAKLVISNLKTVNEDGNRVFNKEKSPIQDGIFNAIDLLPKIYQELGWYYIVAWNKLYHRSLFKNINFPMGKIHEDEYIIVQIMWKAQKIVCISSEEYIYVYQRKGGIMSNRKLKSQYDWLEALYLRFKYCKNIPELLLLANETRAVYFRELNNLFFDLELKKRLTRYQKRELINQYSNMDGKTRNEKINWFLFRICPRLDNYLVRNIRKIRR